MLKPILNHVHLPGLTSYAAASALQQNLVAALLAYKKASTPSNIPPATILTFSPHPTYTHGRRDPQPPSPSQLSLLLSPLETQDHGTLVPTFSNDLRGGKTTFHGPGQLVVWPVFSLDRPYSFEQSQQKRLEQGRGSDVKQIDGKRQRLSPTQYVCLLEGVTINALKNTYGLPSKRTSDPGVWTIDGERKIAALGVHLRRNVTSFGVGLNVHTDPRWWERIVACGLEGKGVTSMVEEGIKFQGEEVDGQDRVQEVAVRWVEEFATQVGAEVRAVGGDIVDTSSSHNLGTDAATIGLAAGLSGAMAGRSAHSVPPTDGGSILPDGESADPDDDKPRPLENHDDSGLAGEIGDLDNIGDVVDVFGDFF